MRTSIQGVLQDGSSGTTQQLEQDQTLVAGDEGLFDLTVVNTAGTVVNLTGYSIIMAVRDPATDTALFQRTATSINATAGTAQFVIIRADTFDATPGNYAWQVKLVQDATSDEFTIVPESTFTVGYHVVNTSNPITPPGPDAYLVGVPAPSSGDAGKVPTLTSISPITLDWGPGGGGTNYQTVKNSAGTSLPQEANLQFAARLAVSDASPSTLVDLATVGTAGTYVSVTTDAYGRVTAGLAPYTLSVQAGTPDEIIFDTGANNVAFLNTLNFYVGDIGAAETAFLAPAFYSDASDTQVIIGNVATNVGVRLVGGSSNTLGHDVPNVADDTLALLGAAQTITGAKTFASGALKQNNSAGTFAHTFASAATAARTWTLPDATDTALGAAATQTITNKSISGSSNTLSNIPQSAVTNLVTNLASKASDWSSLYNNSTDAPPIATYVDGKPLVISTILSTLGVPDANTLASVGFAFGSGSGSSAATPALEFGSGAQAWFLQGKNTSTTTGDLIVYTSQNNGVTTEHSRFIGSGGFKVATIGPSSSQQHTLPAVSSDTVALLAASQTFTNKTLTSPVLGSTVTGTYTLGGTPTITAPIINGATSASGNFDLSGSSGTFLTCTGANTLSGNVTVADTKTLSLSYSAVGNAQTVVASLANSTAATSGTTEQWSPMMEFKGASWDTGASSSKAVKMGWQIEGISQSGNPLPVMQLYSSSNGASYTKVFSLAASSTGTASITGFGSAAGQLGQLTFTSQAISLGFNTSALNPTSDKGSSLGGSGTKWSVAYAYQHSTATQSSTASGAVSIDPANGEVYQLTANGNITGLTLATTNVKDGEIITLILKQDSGGTSTWPTTITNARLIGGSFTKSTGANAVDSIQFRYNGAASKFDQVAPLCAALA